MTSKDEAKSGSRDDRLSGPQRAMHREVEAIRKQMLADARDACPETRAAYVECAKGRTFTVAWYCKGLFREFNECLKNQCAAAKKPAATAQFYRLPSRASACAARRTRSSSGGSLRKGYGQLREDSGY